MSPLKTLLISTLTITGFGVAACSGNTVQAPDETAVEAINVAKSLGDVIAHPRRADDMARDKFRNPEATLEFFGLEPGQTVGEVWPGWYTKIIAPYLAENGGTYVAVLRQAEGNERAMKRNQAFIDAYVGQDGYGDIQTAAFGSNPAPIAEPNSLDLLLSFRNVHNWMGGDYAEKAFSDFYDVLKPGGVLGIVEHRLPETAVQNPKGRTGYVQESYMESLAQKAGFEFVESSEVNANPKDTADHPVGVWTLPPRSAVPKEGSPEADGFDAALYKNIGESDRATLKFRKPL